MLALLHALIVPLVLGVMAVGPAAAADDKPDTDTATREAEPAAAPSGSGPAVEGAAKPAKGVGDTVVDGVKVAGSNIAGAARATGRSIAGAGKTVGEGARTAWEVVRDGAIDAADAMVDFFERLSQF
jgi:hypothetical protein